MLKMIVAMDKNNGIGKSNQLLCYIPNDLKYFKDITKDQIVVMGRKTWDSLPIKPLPNRKNVILTHNKYFMVNDENVFTNVDFGLIKFLGKNVPYKDIFIIGGQSIYQQFMPHVDMLYVTHIHEEFEADTFFPEISRDVWKLVSYESGVKTNHDEPEFTHAIYQRIEK